MATSLPVVLAGPILRRTDITQVCIWLATSVPVQVEAGIFTRRPVLSLPGPGKPIASGQARSVKLGSRLYVTLVRAFPAQPAPGGPGRMPVPRGPRGGIPQLPGSISLGGGATYLPEDELLEYDLLVTYGGGSSSVSRSLKELGLLSGKNAISYKEGERPSFFIPSRARRLNALQGSCRKLHGPGEDALARASDELAKTLEDLEERPSALFLTGDQIYADDVAAPLMPHLVRLANTLVGGQERIPGIPEPVGTLPVSGRTHHVQRLAGFTSEAASNHLMAFGEFAAMYLLAWNGELWPEALPTVAQTFPRLSKLFKRPVPAKSRSKSPKQSGGKKPGLPLEVILDFHQRKSAEQFSEEREALERARKVLPNVRRLLANIPTYMIFDDHEVTDDWNLSVQWTRRAMSRPAGRRIIANGLAAYWAFQGWGNDPERFTPAFVQGMSSHLGHRGSQSAESFEQALLGMSGWTYVAPTSPPALVLDSRTQRTGRSSKEPSELMSESALAVLPDLAARAGYRPGSPLMVVAPAPVFGIEWIEEGRGIIGSGVRIFDALASSLPFIPDQDNARHTSSMLDLEAWGHNVDGYLRLMKSLLHLQPSHCVILSGDVHYGFSRQVDFFHRAFKPVRFSQLTSSSLKNYPKGLEEALLRLPLLDEEVVVYGFDRDDFLEHVKGLIRLVKGVPLPIIDGLFKWMTKAPRAEVLELVRTLLLGTPLSASSLGGIKSCIPEQFHPQLKEVLSTVLPTELREALSSPSPVQEFLDGMLSGFVRALETNRSFVVMVEGSSLGVGLPGPLDSLRMLFSGASPSWVEVRKLKRAFDSSLSNQLFRSTNVGLVRVDATAKRVGHRLLSTETIERELIADIPMDCALSVEKAAAG